MNQIVTLPRLVARLMEATGESKDTCENFVVALTRTVCDALADRDTAKVAGFGQFIATPATAAKVMFVPSKEFVATINAPFDAFEPEVLSPDVTDQMLGMAPVVTPTADTPAPPVFIDFFMKQQ